MNKTQYSLIQNYHNQTFIQDDGGIGIINLKNHIKVIPRLRGIILITEKKMNLIQFKQKKYGSGFVDLKKITKEFNQNEKDKKKYYALKNTGKTSSLGFYDVEGKNYLVIKKNYERI